MTAAEDAAHRGRPAGRAWLAWLVILLVSALAVGAQAFQPRAVDGEGRLDYVLLEVQAKYLVGAATLFPDEADASLERQLEEWDPPGAGQRLRIAILAGELSGPQPALQRLRALQEGSLSAPGGRESVDPLIRLFEDYAQDKPSAPSVSDAEKRRLQSELGWFGKLALASPSRQGSLREEVLSQARQTVFLILGVVAAIGLTGLAGLTVLIIFLALLFAGSLDNFDRSPAYGGVYAEAFAVWLILFLGLNIGSAVWLGAEAVISIGLLSLGGSLLAIGWPWLRGISWNRIRQDLGWTRGRGTLRESLLGLAGYAMAIPLAILAVLLTALIVHLAGNAAGSGGMPVHPAAEWLVDASGWQQVQLLVLACVVAPLVEETVFRGLLYRHLREATAALSDWAGVLLSAVITSLFFAVLHPQGLLAVPGIMGIAMALTFLREWRATLLPSMVAHGLNNGVAMLILLTFVS